MARKSDVRLTDNSDSVRNALPSQIAAALEAIGLQAEGYAKLKAPVDTERLRNSLTHTVREKEKTVYIGTNVEYAAYQEFGTVKTRAHPYLKPAVTEHTAEYKAIIEHFLKQ